MKKLIAIGLLMISFSVHATQVVSNLTVSHLSCNTVNTICTIDISGSPVGPAGCVSNTLAWDTNASIYPGGKNALSALLAAMVASRTVTFAIADTCYDNSPTFNWFTVK